MSNGRRYRRRHHEHIEVAARIACTTTDNAEDLEQAKRVSHDALIATLGPARRSGVSWHIIGPDDRAEALDALSASGEVREWFVANPEGWLVVATCEAVRS